MSAPRVLVYSEANMNGIDGSTVWAQSMCQVLSAAGAEVVLPLRFPVTSELITAPIEALPGATVVRAVEAGLAPEPLTPETAVQVILGLDREQRFDVVLVRGLRVAARVAQTRHFNRRLWAYLVDLPLDPQQRTAGHLTQAERVFGAAGRLLVQTPLMRAAVEAEFPAVADRLVVWNPVLPPGIEPAPAHEPAGSVLLGYMGKYSPGYRTLEMTRVPALLAERGVHAELHMLGDTIHRPRDLPDFHDQMLAALQEAPGVVWHGGMPRAKVLEQIARVHFGLCWRGPEFDDSSEISTKLLEFSGLGIPVVLNPTVAHRQLYGEDYPFYAESVEAVADAVQRGAADPTVYQVARERCLAAADQFTFERAAARMGALLNGE